MSWITEINESDASDELKKVFQEIKTKRGKISNIMSVHSLNPGSMKYHMDLYVHLMFGSSPLSRADREFIAVLVSIFNNCTYCVRHHLEALRHYWKDGDVLDEMLQDIGAVDLDPRLYSLMVYVKKLTRAPSEVIEGDISELRKQGFTDRGILDISVIVGYFNFVNRIVLGLGVEATSEEISGYKY